jgi:rod shape-determining protein MreC
MDFLLGRYRNLTILVGVLFLQVLGLAVQVKRSGDAENTRLIRIWAVDAITPLERALIWAQNGTRGVWRNYCYLRGVRAENRDLKQQVEQMRLQEVRLSEDAGQAHRLQLLLAFREQYISKTVAAQVIGSSASDLSRSIYIDKGSNDKIAPDMAVITSGGIVGKVLRVFPSTSLVLMINDQSSGVGAMLEKSRLQGVLRGTADGQVTLERVMSDETVTPGETVLSSGGDQIFPKGLPVGTVTAVRPGKEMFLNITVKPAADLNRLEEVLVVTEKQEQSPVADGGVRVRAADILAERLPSVPDKPATAASNATTGEGGTKPLGQPAISEAAKPGSMDAVAKVQTSTAASAKAGDAEHVATLSTATAQPQQSMNPGETAKVSPAATSAKNSTQATTGHLSTKAAPGAAAGGTGSGNGSTPAASSGATVPAKPRTLQAKAPAAQTNPPTTQDDPH